MFNWKTSDNSGNRTQVIGGFKKNSQQLVSIILFPEEASLREFEEWMAVTLLPVSRRRRHHEEKTAKILKVFFSRILATSEQTNKQTKIQTDRDKLKKRRANKHTN